MNLTSGLDPVHAAPGRNCSAREKEKGKHILITTHIMSASSKKWPNGGLPARRAHLLLSGYFQELEGKYDATSLERAIARILREGEWGLAPMDMGRRQPSWC